MLEANELIPLYLLDDRRCVLLDSGLAKEREEIEKTLLEAGLELAFFYVFVIGYYPVLRQQLARIKSTLLRWVIKFAVFNGATVLVYLLLFALLGPAILDELLADGVGMLAALLAAGNLSFWLCDRAVGALTRYYRLILKKKLNFLH